MSDKVTQHAFRVKVDGIREPFNTFSGGNMERESTRTWSGGSDEYEDLLGPGTYSNIEVSKDYRLSDEDWLADWRGKQQVRRATISKQPLDENGRAVGKAITYKGCKLVGITEPDTERGAASQATVSLAFTTTGPA